MDDRRSTVIDDYTHLERLAALRRADEHRDVRIIGLVRLPVVPERVEHVVVRDAVPASRRLDVHDNSLRRSTAIVNTCCRSRQLRSPT